MVEIMNMKAQGKLWTRLETSFPSSRRTRMQGYSSENESSEHFQENISVFQNTSSCSCSPKALRILRSDVHKMRLGNRNDKASIFGNVLFDSTLCPACSDKTIFSLCKITVPMKILSSPQYLCETPPLYMVFELQG